MAFGICAYVRDFYKFRDCYIRECYVRDVYVVSTINNDEKDINKSDTINQFIEHITSVINEKVS